MGSRPRSVTVAQVLFGAVGGVTAFSLFTGVPVFASLAPHPDRWFILVVGSLLGLAVLSLAAAGVLGGERRRWGWWFGIAGVVVLALAGAVILLSPLWVARNHLTSARLFSGLLVLAVAGALLAALLVPGTRRWVREAPPRIPGSSQPAEVWRVAEPGADLTDRPGGTGIVARLAPGTVLVGVKRRRDHIRVTAPDGQSGWVEQRWLH